MRGYIRTINLGLVMLVKQNYIVYLLLKLIRRLVLGLYTCSWASFRLKRLLVDVKIKGESAYHLYGLCSLKDGSLPVQKNSFLTFVVLSHACDLIRSAS